MTGGVPKAFLEHIVANVDEDTPRLAYADWLDENGRAERAEFIRVQVDRARLPAWDAAQVRLRLREAELLKAHGEEWLAEIPAVAGARWEGFRRGVVAEVSFTDFEAMRATAHACRAVAPVEAVTVRWPRGREAKDAAPIAELRELFLTGRPSSLGEVGWLADSPQLATVRTLNARGLWAEGLGRLVRSPHLGRLAVLRLPGNNLGNAGIVALTGAASLSALEELDLSGQGVSERYADDPVVRSPGMEALAGWPGLGSVRRLTLTGNELGPLGLRALLRSPHAAGLRELTARGARVDGAGMAEFADAHKGLRLEVLDVGENVLKDVGAEYAALVPCLRELKVLRLDRCEVSLTGAKLFAKKAALLGGVRVLDVGHNHFGPAGLAALLGRKPPALHTLGFRDNDLHDEGAEVLAGSAASDTLLDVDLCRNGLGPGAASALGDSDHLRELLILRLTDNPLGASAAALKASPLGRRLAVLELDAPPAPLPVDDDGDPIPF